MSNKTQKKKLQKKVARRKRLDKERNIKSNKANYRYRLDVKFEGEWKVYTKFKNADEAQRHLDETNEIIRRGDTEVIEGRIIDLKSFNQVAHINAFKPGGPEMSLKDISKMDLASEDEVSEINKEDIRDAISEINKDFSQKTGK